MNENETEQDFRAITKRTTAELAEMISKAAELLLDAHLSIARYGLPSPDYRAGAMSAHLQAASHTSNSAAHWARAVRDLEASQ